MSHYDLFILGGGLAGFLLAHRLEQAGKSFLIFDDEYENSSSRIAAGIIHPITGRRIVKSWKADEFIPVAFETYLALETELNTKFFTPFHILELIDDTFTFNQWMERSSEEGFQNYFAERRSLPQGLREFKHHVEIKNSGQLNTVKFLSDMKDKWKSKSQFITKKVNEKDIQFLDDKVSIENFSAREIVFCSGAASAQSKLWSYLPWKLAKGEILDLEIENLSGENIYNATNWLFPSGENVFRAGSTYQWDHLDDVPTTQARQQIETGIQKMLAVNYKVIAHRAGIRPSVKDRKPFLGRHPQIKNAIIFNGLGAKGVMMAPLLSKQLANYLIHENPLMEETNICKYDSLY